MEGLKIWEEIWLLRQHSKTSAQTHCDQRASVVHTGFPARPKQEEKPAGGGSIQKVERSQEQAAGIGF
jgi:hypothetical protein